VSVLVTGANGFVGMNLVVHLRENGIEPVLFTRGMNLSDLKTALINSEFIFHLAGANRPIDVSDFSEDNSVLTRKLCDLVYESGRSIPVLYTSSTQAELNNPYGESKLAAESSLINLEKSTGSPVYLYRLSNIFGKWSKPNYNSVVATFCHNVVKSLPIQINDPTAQLYLTYIDDVVADFLRLMKERPSGVMWPKVYPIYTITVGQLADQIMAFKTSRETATVEAVGVGLTRALYATYLSFQRPEQFSYPLSVHADSRGRFVEILKTKDSGQFSFFTAPPGITRGGHYHHSKNEKFLVMQGKAKFRFRHLITGEIFELYTDGGKPEIVETVPGWSHDIMNIGDTEMIVMLWANEIFDRERPDTMSENIRIVNEKN
jgi:UDP-2-acetamido-2,6-beta-L-arabino-hexul-4-ose reductase